MQQELACSERSNLKLYFAKNRKYLCYSKSRSTKTRIETMPDTFYYRGYIYSKSRSTKTRIETRVPKSVLNQIGAIQNQDPLKQGLKQDVLKYGSSERRIQNQDPLKQGLKLDLN